MASLMASLASRLSIAAPLAPSSSASPPRSSTNLNNNGVWRIDCSSHPQKKATAHHAKSRPKKHQPYDKNRKGPTHYKRLPKPPPIWGFDTSDLDQTDAEAGSAETASA